MAMIKYYYACAIVCDGVHSFVVFSSRKKADEFFDKFVGERKLNELDQYHVYYEREARGENVSIVLCKKIYDQW